MREPLQSSDHHPKAGVFETLNEPYPLHTELHIARDPAVILIAQSFGHGGDYPSRLIFYDVPRLPGTVTNGFKRLQGLQGAIDSRIAEEQARQRSSSGSVSSPSRSDGNLRRTSSGRTRSPTKRPARPRVHSQDSSDRSLQVRGPDPSEFDPEFVIGSETPSRTSTPQIKEDADPPPKKNEAQPGGEDGNKHDENKESAPGEQVQETPQQPPELPIDVKTKLRKLEKLEPRYSDLLRSYRIAHARILLIEPFEATLREHTPLTSIGDPNALVEYLNQMTQRSGMVMEELKRVSTENADIRKERDALKDKLDTAEKIVSDVKSENESLRKASTQNSPAVPDFDRLQVNGVGDKQVEMVDRALSPVAPKASLPSKEVTAHEDSKEESEDFFSYDDELPRLQGELKQRDQTVQELTHRNKALEDELEVAKESTEKMVQNLETATRDLQTLRDAKERSEAESLEQYNRLDSTSETLKSNLEAAEKELSKLRDGSVKHESVVANLQATIWTTEKELAELRAQADEKEEQGATAESAGLITKLQADLDQMQKDMQGYEKRSETLNGLIKTLREQLQNAETAKKTVESDLLEARRERDEALQQASAIHEHSQHEHNQDDKPTPQAAENSSAAKKKKNKKKKGKSQAPDATESLSKGSEPPAPAAKDVVEGQAPKNAMSALGLAKQLDDLKSDVDEKDKAIDRLEKRLKDQEALTEEIEGLKDDLINVGQEHTDAKDKMKVLQAEKNALEESMKALEKELAELKISQAGHIDTAEAHKSLTTEFEELRAKADTLQTDLSAAQSLAASRFKDLTDMREILQKAQPELHSLRSEVNELRSSKDELAQARRDVSKLETRERDLRSEISVYMTQVAEKTSETRLLTDRLQQATSTRQALEDSNRRMQRDLQRSETERSETAETAETFRADRDRANQELSGTRSRAAELDASVSRLTQELQSLREELDLRSAQRASAQSLLDSMQDQTRELATQLRERRARAEALEEELADAHRLLSERGREAETMRRLLGEVEHRAEARVKEMRERVDVAVEERDRAEEEASVSGRRRARELEELRGRVREAERGVKRAEEEREEVERERKRWESQREELERRAAQAGEEAGEMRGAMGELRDALDEGERQTRELEKEKGALRKSLEETQGKLEKLQKSSRSMADDLRALQAKTRAPESNTQSSRSSLEFSPSRARLASPMPKGRVPSVTELGNVKPEGATDLAYLKNVLLQFLEQRDKKLQTQLVPVLGMLLHFNRDEEQKWSAAIAAR
ncbi:MAG: hypothetical protein M1821_009327 [Bathelium mastoideum]|nr:MAG: hypothetical protein M1821_009327 [Bathelium mastoideum]